MSIYKLRAKHEGRDAYWEATILAPDLLTAGLWLKKRARAEEMPSVTHKNGRRYVRSGNRAFYRNAKLDSLRVGRKPATAKAKKELEDAVDRDNAKAQSKFNLCKIIEESPYVLS